MRQPRLKTGGAPMKPIVSFRYFVFTALVAGLLGVISGASAQQRIQVTIPFAFTANHQLMPAGDYQVRLVNPDVMMLIADGTKTDKGIYLEIRPESELNAETHSCLTFLHPGARYYLKEVRIAGLNA